jgi:hypothetical protein
MHPSGIHIRLDLVLSCHSGEAYIKRLLWVTYSQEHHLPSKTTQMTDHTARIGRVVVCSATAARATAAIRPVHNTVFLGPHTTSRRVLSLASVNLTRCC